MPVQGQWYIRGRVYQFKFSGDIIEPDVREAIRLSYEALEQYPPSGTTHSITDLTEVTRYDLKLMELKNALAGLEKIKATGYGVLVGTPNVVIKFAITVISQLFGFRVALFPTMEEAVTFLHQQDPTLLPQSIPDV